MCGKRKTALMLGPTANENEGKSLTKARNIIRVGNPYPNPGSRIRNPSNFWSILESEYGIRFLIADSDY